MASLTDGAIRAAIKTVGKTGKQKTLSDGEGRGVGRLVLILKPMPTRVTAEWMRSSGATVDGPKLRSATIRRCL